MKTKYNLIQKLAFLLIVFSFTCIAANALPDLNVSGYSVDPSPGCIGQPQILIFDVKNIGNAAANNAAAIVTAGGTSTTISGINISAGATKKFIVAVPAFSSGSIMLDPLYSSNYMKAIYSSANTCSNSYTNTPLKRYTSSALMDRFYSISGETISGYTYDHNEGKVSTNWVSGTTPLFQFYHGGATSHFYTTKTDQPSLQGVLYNNYNYEKVQGYIYTSQVSGTVPLYHLYHQTNIDHFYTISDIEKTNAINNLGFQDKGIEGYVYPNDPVYTYDLQAIDIWVSGTPTAGQSTIIYYQVKNNNSSISSYNVAVYLDNVLQGYETKYNIGAGEYATGSLSITASQGNHNVKIFVDYGNQWSEINENNNNLTEVIYWQAAPLPAPRPANISNLIPPAGSNISYVLHYDAYPMTAAYRTFVHFKADNDAIIINDDHYPDFAYPYIPTNSQFFTGSDFSYYGRNRTVTIPANFSGRLRMVTGFYNESAPGVNVALRTNYATNIGNNQYLIGEINVAAPVVQLTAPNLASFSNLNPKSGDSITYTINLEAYPMNKSYRTFMHFLDDSGNIIINDDHWINGTLGFATNSASFSGTVSYSRNVNIPYYFDGKLRIVTGFYSYDNNIEGDRINLSTKYVSDISYNRYKIGEVNVASRLALSGKIIVLDPGHGAGYPGAVGADGEAEANDKISANLKVLLEDLGATVYETPSTYDVNQRASFANSKNADIFLSIHFNGDASTQTTGVESFYGAVNYGGINGAPQNDTLLCQAVVPQVKNLLGSKLRGTNGIKPDTQTAVGALPVLRYSNMPACLVEMEFITAVNKTIFREKLYNSYKELFLSEDYQNEAARVLKEAILNYFIPSQDIGGWYDSYNDVGAVQKPICITMAACTNPEPVDDSFKGFIYPINESKLTEPTVTTYWAGSYIFDNTVEPDRETGYTEFGGRHPGVDFDYGSNHNYGKDWIDCSESEAKIVAFADGVVINTTRAKDGWGNYVIIEHDNMPSPDHPNDCSFSENITSIYAHLCNYSVTVGQEVKQGDVIGIMGGTAKPGKKWYDHLHFQIERDTDTSINLNLFNEATYLPWLKDRYPFTTSVSGYHQWNIPEKLSVYLDLSSDETKPLYSATNKAESTHPADENSPNYLPQDIEKITINPRSYIEDNKYGSASAKCGYGGSTSLKYDQMKHPNGTIIKEEGGTKLYYLDNGKLRYIPSPHFIKDNGLRVTAIVKPQEFALYEKDSKDLSYPDGTLISYNGDKYIISEGQKRKFVRSLTPPYYGTIAPYQELGYNDNQFITITVAKEFDVIPSGPDINNGADYPAGAYIYNNADGEYYIIKKNSAGGIEMSNIFYQFERQALGLEEVGDRGKHLMSSVALAIAAKTYREYNLRTTIRSGTLIAIDETKKLYVVDENQLRFIVDTSTVYARGYSFSDFFKVTAQQFKAIPFWQGANLQVVEEEVNRHFLKDDSNTNLRIALQDAQEGSTATLSLLDGSKAQIGGTYQATASNNYAEFNVPITANAKYALISTRDMGGGADQYIDSLDYIGSDEKIQQEIINNPMDLEYNRTPIFNAEGDRGYEDEEISTTPPSCPSGDLVFSKSGSTKLCSNTTITSINISSSNVILDLNGATITGGIFATSGYTIDNASADLQGINGSATKAQINAILSTKPLFENITIMNGNFVNCDVGMNLSIVRNLKITNNTFTNCQNGIIAASINSEITGNTINLDSSSSGYAIGVGGMDTLISANIINGNYEQGIGMLGWNLTAQSNIVDNANKGIGMLGFYNNVKGNSISNSKDAISGLFVLGADVSNNRMDTNENGISVICFDSSIADSNVILSSSNKAIELKQFLNNMCSKNSSIKNNKLIAQTSPSIRIMKTDVDGDKVIYDNNLLNNTYCDSETSCGIVIPQNNATNQTNATNNTVVPKTYTIVYVPGELRNVSGIVMGNNFEDVYAWKQSPMQKINSTYQITFENISAGERDFNIKYNVDGVSYDYYSLTTQGMSGDVYVNGIKIDCEYTGYYSDRLAANYKIVADGNGNFTKPSASGNLPGCDQLCAPEKLSKRVAWLSNGSMYIPDAVFTGNCYKEKNGTNYGLIFNCPVLGKDIKLSEKFDWWQRTVNFTAQNSKICGLTDTTFNQKFYAADIEAQNRGFNQVYSDGEYNYWLDLNQCHPDVKLVDNSAHTIMPSNRTTTNPVCG